MRFRELGEAIDDTIGGVEDFVKRTKRCLICGLKLKNPDHWLCAKCYARNANYIDKYRRDR